MARVKAGHLLARLQSLPPQEPNLSCPGMFRLRWLRRFRRHGLGNTRVLRADVPRRLPTAGRVPAAHSADPRHMIAVGAHPFTPLAARLPGLVGGEFVGGALFVGRPAPSASNFPLFFRIHRSESTISAAGLHPSLHSVSATCRRRVGRSHDFLDCKNKPSAPKAARMASCPCACNVDTIGRQLLLVDSWRVR